MNIAEYNPQLFLSLYIQAEFSHFTAKMNRFKFAAFIYSQFGDVHVLDILIILVTNPAYR